MTGPTPYTPGEGHVICLRQNVPEGWEYRARGLTDGWIATDASAMWQYDQIVEARPAQQPDPAHLTRFVVEGRTHWVTWVGEMRGRTDLDQWEYADTEGYWNSWAPSPVEHFDRVADRSPDFPVIVRRKAGGL